MKKTNKKGNHLQTITMRAADTQLEHQKAQGAKDMANNSTKDEPLREACLQNTTSGTRPTPRVNS
eukprot:4249515-Amphidinium_carterae.2